MKAPKTEYEYNEWENNMKIDELKQNEKHITC